MLLDAASFAQICSSLTPPASIELERLTPGSALVEVRALPLDENGGGNPWLSTRLWLLVQSISENEILGEVVISNFDHEGMRMGDRMSVGIEKVFDAMTLADDGRPVLSERRARSLLHKRVLVGLTAVNDDGDRLETRQFVATVESVDTYESVRLRLDDGSSYYLPPDSRPFHEAAPGEYRLRSSGEVVVDPDYICTWTVTVPEGGNLDDGFSL